MTDAKLAEHDNLFRNAIDALEDSYEFMIAYAAQGRRQETDDEGPSKIRHSISTFKESLEKMASSDYLSETREEAFWNRFVEDLVVVKSALELIEAQKSISSDMVDNTNALLCMRSLLTSIFFIDQVLLPPRQTDT